MQDRIIILSDSRGRGLTTKISRESGIPRSVHVNGIAKGGAKLDNLLDDLKRLQHRYRRDNITALIFGGICNLTTKSGDPKRRDLQIFYRRSHKNIRHMKWLIDQLIETAKDKSVDLILSTIPPANLLAAKQNNIQKNHLSHHKCMFSDSELQRQQLDLESDIVSINKHIIARCKRADISLFNPNKAICRDSVKDKPRNKKRRREQFTYNCFKEDGVHAGEYLEEEWFTKITNLCIRKKNPAQAYRYLKKVPSARKLLRLQQSDAETVQVGTSASSTEPNHPTNNTADVGSKTSDQRVTLVADSTEDTQSKEEAIAYKRKRRNPKH
jgi:hypothetical protein